jgi:transposase
MEGAKRPKEELAMAKRSTVVPERTVGLDLGDRHIQFCVLDAAGQKIEEGTLTTSAERLRDRFEGQERTRVALEVGTHSPWISRLLEEWGHEVLVANPARLALISKSHSKDDRHDAETLARLARSDPRLLSPIEHRTADVQADLALIRARNAAVRTRTLLVNHVRGVVKSGGGRLPRCSAESFANRVLAALPEDRKPALLPLLGVIQKISTTIREYDHQIEALSEQKYPQTALLREVPGVGPLTALAFVLTVGRADRFPKSRTVGAYLGLRPRRSESGERAPELPITKAGNSHLRWLLVSSAQFLLGPFGPACALREWGLRLAARGGKNAKKRAVVALARKLAVVLHHLWKTGEVYQPFPGQTVAAPTEPPSAESVPERGSPRAANTRAHA